MTYETLSLEEDVSSRVACITLNRPEVHNALNERIRLELADALAEVRGNPAIGALVLTGGSDRAFSVGADLKDSKTDHSTTDFDQYIADQERTGGWYQLLNRFPKGVVVATGGYTAGSGLQLALTADVMIATPAAQFWVPQISLGLAPHVGTLLRLARNIGQQRMWRLILTGERLDAASALEWGLVSEVVAAEELLPRAREIAAKIAAQPPLAVQITKEAYFQSLDMTWDQAMALDRIKAFAMWQSDDRRSRHAAFRDRSAKRGD